FSQTAVSGITPTLQCCRHHYPLPIAKARIISYFTRHLPLQVFGDVADVSESVEVCT
ncbi:hypothetical protein FA13DRAFT_1741735, partial [Coprinellus micaceus]